MNDSEKYKFVFHLVPSGLEFAIFVHGSHQRSMAVQFLNEKLNARQVEEMPSHNNQAAHFVVDDEQFEAFRDFLRRATLE